MSENALNLVQLPPVPEHRARRARSVRSRTISRRVPVRRLAVYPRGVERPRTRRDCLTGPRPCPWVSCKYHLYLDVTPIGSVKLNFPDLEPHELPVSCALDVAAHGGLSAERLAPVMNITRERVRQVEAKALSAIDIEDLRSDPDGGGVRVHLRGAL